MVNEMNDEIAEWLNRESDELVNGKTVYWLDRKLVD
jgi:hypothetical protein